MNIFHKIALEGLKKNRARTLVTIVGVALAAALITAVATLVVSLQNYMIDGATKKYGDWQVEFPDVDASFIQTQEADSRVANVVSYKNIGYAVLDGGKNPDKPYLFLAGFSGDAFDVLPVELLNGRWPRNDREIVIPAHVSSNGGVKITVGDTLSLKVGDRREGERNLSQHDGYRGQGETLGSTTEKVYQVVGICQRPTFEERSAPGYTAITLGDMESAADSYSAFVTVRRSGQIRTYAQSEANGRDYLLNDEVLRFMGISGDQMFRTLLYWAGGIFIALVMVCSVFLIYDAFHISLNQRTHEFGVLLSVGATRRQLRNAVLFEGGCIGAVGIPLGILVGIPSIGAVLTLVSKNFSSVLYDGVPLTLKISAPTLGAAAAISMVTILISAYLPARKACGMPVMECIRQTNEIKAEARSVRTSGVVNRLCGVEGMIALKNFKRNRRQYRGIILSLTMSVLLFVSASVFGADLEQASEQAKVVTDYDVGFGTEEMEERELLALYGQLKETEGVEGSTCQALLEYSCQVPVEKLTGYYWKGIGQSPGEGMTELPVEIQFLDDATYEKILQDQGMSASGSAGESPKMIAVAKMDDDSGQAEDVSQLHDIFTSGTVEVTVSPKSGGAVDAGRESEVEITCVETTPPDIPPSSRGVSQQPYFFQIMAPWSLRGVVAPDGDSIDARVLGFTFQSGNPAKTTEALQRKIQGNGVTASYTLYNVHEMLEESRNIQFVVKLFTALFTGMISLIAMANVFNTISTNVKLRRRELAMLRSVGMSERDFDRMMAMECIFYGAGTLAWGLPLCAFASWLIYRGMVAGGAAIKFQFPWSALGASVLGVFGVIFVTMLYAVGKVRRENIIDALRDDMG